MNNNLIKAVSFHLLVIVVFFLATSNCVSFQNDNSARQIIMPEKKVLLEIATISTETSYPHGEVLDIRLYNTKEVEFDFYPPHTPERLGMKFTIEKKKTKLSQEDFDKLTSLLRESDLLNAKDRYDPRRISPMSVDSTIRKNITFTSSGRDKRIVVEEYDSRLFLDDVPTYITAKPNIYPKSLIELLKTVEVINRRLRVQIDPASQ